MEVELYVDNGFEDDEDNEDSDWGLEGEGDEGAEDDGDVHDDDSRVGGGHELCGFGGFVFSLEQEVVYEGDTVAGEEHEEDWFCAGGQSGPCLSDDSKEQLEEDEEAGPCWAAAGAGEFRLGLGEEGEDEYSVNGHESAVVDHEEWDHEELAKVFDGLFDGGEGDFEDVVESDDEVFGPVQ